MKIESPLGLQLNASLLRLGKEEITDPFWGGSGASMQLLSLEKAPYALMQARIECGPPVPATNNFAGYQPMVLVSVAWEILGVKNGVISAVANFPIACRAQHYTKHLACGDADVCAYCGYLHGREYGGERDGYNCNACGGS